MRLLATIVSVIGLLVGIIGAGFAGWEMSQQRADAERLGQARSLLAEGKPRAATLALLPTLERNADQLEALELMAEAADMARSSRGLAWHIRLAEVNPTAQNRLKLAAAALHCQPPPWSLTDRILREIKPTSQNMPSYHEVAAELAMKQGRLEEVEQHFEQALRLKPGNEMTRLNLAAIKLFSNEASRQKEGLSLCEQLSSRPDVSVLAMRWLMAYHISQGNRKEAAVWADKLNQTGHPSLENLLQKFSVQELAGKPVETNALASLQQQAVANPSAIYNIAEWMSLHGRGAAAYLWLTNLSRTIKTNIPVAVATADSLIASRDWEKLEGFLQREKNWSEFEFLRYGYLALAASEYGQEMARPTRWRAAIRESSLYLGPLVVLLDMAHTRGWWKEREDLLLEIGRKFPQQHWALDELQSVFYAENDTRNINKISALIYTIDPKNWVAKNNLALTSLLLKNTTLQTHQMAKELYAAQPLNPNIVATYAYSLHLQARTVDASRALEKLKPEILEKPPIAIYYGLVLVTMGERDKPRRLLGLAHTATLLPEEKTLALDALRTIEAPATPPSTNRVYQFYSK